MKILAKVVISLLVLLFSACGFSSDVKAPLAVQPESGKTTVTGRLLALKTNAPLTETIVRLAEVHREGDEGAYVLDISVSPSAVTNDEGFFIFPNILPGEYVMVAGNIFSLYKVIADEDGNPKVWDARADIILEMGNIFVTLEPTQE